MVARRGTHLRYGQAMRKRRRVVRARAGYSAVPRTAGWVGHGEMKYFDTGYGATAIPALTTTWASSNADPTTFLTLCDPVKGAGISERVGRKIHIRYIKIKGYVASSAQTLQSGGDGASSIRFILFQDEQTNAAQAAGTVLMDGQPNGGQTINSFQNLDSLGRFRVLKDKRWTLGNPTIANDTGGTGGIVQSGRKIHFKVNHHFRKPVTVNFNATNGGTIADITDNSFHILCATDDVSMVPTLTYSCRVGYKDA